MGRVGRYGSDTHTFLLFFASYVLPSYQGHCLWDPRFSDFSSSIQVFFIMLLAVAMFVLRCSENIASGVVLMF